MSRLVIRVEGTAPDYRVLVKCGGPGKRTVYATRKAGTPKVAKDAVKSAVEEAEALVAGQ